MNKPTITIINGSAQTKSLNLKYATFVHKLLQKAGADANLIHLGEVGLPLFTGFDQEPTDAITQTREQIKKSDGYIIMVPEYHHEPPAALKNLFEHIPAGKDGSMVDKPVALVSASPTQFGGVRAQNSLLPMLRTFRMWLVPDEVLIPHADKLLDESGNITDEDIKDRITSLVTRLLKATELLSPLHS